jgi:hypothetical protein
MYLERSARLKSSPDSLLSRKQDLFAVKSYPDSFVIVQESISAGFDAYLPESI